jgi:coiled-coil domain-containing protein 130
MSLFSNKISSLEYDSDETLISISCNNGCDILQTCEYIIVSGARRQENRWDPKENEQLVPEDKSTSKRLFDDAMFKLEHGYGDKKQADGVQPTLAKLTAKRQKLWQDDYAANCVLRQQFRVSDSLLFKVFMHSDPLS